MRKAFLTGAVLLVLPVLAHAQTQNSGRDLAASCAICHGSEGRAVTSSVVNLAGMPREQIETQMRAFRDDKRPATVMHQIAKGYTDAQIEAMAQWYSAQTR